MRMLSHHPPDQFTTSSSRSSSVDAVSQASNFEMITSTWRLSKLTADGRSASVVIVAIFRLSPTATMSVGRMMMLYIACLMYKHCQVTCSSDY